MSQSSAFSDALAQSKAWPLIEAKRLLTRCERLGKKTIIFETGYGPSGLPHIGTFAEVVRTSMVRHAVGALAPDVETQLICFSDDMDGLRRVPDNVPNRDMLAAHLDKPLSAVPNPFDKAAFGEYESFAAHNNARLRAFLDRFEFEYHFASASEYYRSGRMDGALLLLLKNYEAICDIIVPTLRAERAANYSPFLPICPLSGRVLYVPLVAHDGDSGMITYRHPQTDEIIETAVTGGKTKLQWKADWAMRWIALGIDYEMYGKDLAESAVLSKRICDAVGAPSPEGFAYEMFLDANGEKISKSRGNGLSIEEWLTYAPPASLAYYMYPNPKRAKRLDFDVIVKTVDEYLKALTNMERDIAAADDAAMYKNPIWHISGDKAPASLPLSFTLLLNLVSAARVETHDALWGFIKVYKTNLSAATHPLLDELVGYALNYFRDFLAPHLIYRAPTEDERFALEDLRARLAVLPSDAPAAEIQAATYAAGKTRFADALSDWFGALYQILLGQNRGPRFGSFVALYGIEKTCTLISEALDGALVKQQSEDR